MMSMSNLSPEARAAQESARQKSGQFGEQHKSDPGQLDGLTTGSGTENPNAAPSACARCGADTDAHDDQKCAGFIRIYGMRATCAALPPDDDQVVIIPGQGMVRVDRVWPHDLDPDVHWIAGMLRQGGGVVMQVDSDQKLVLPQTSIDATNLNPGMRVLNNDGMVRTVEAVIPESGSVTVRYEGSPMYTEESCGPLDQFTVIQPEFDDLAYATVADLAKRGGCRLNLDADTELIEWHQKSAAAAMEAEYDEDIAAVACKRAAEGFSTYANEIEPGVHTIRRDELDDFRAECRFQYEAVEAENKFGPHGNGVVPAERVEKFGAAIVNAARHHEANGGTAPMYIIDNPGGWYDCYSEPTGKFHPGPCVAVYGEYGARTTRYIDPDEQF